mmetsp:Transcript_23322/g.28600  ORF Transcript_23322/g.28600 Transcript_23322/m.28600 type:complete len:168 (+) Transcript_23322:1045-1548(+)
MLKVSSLFCIILILWISYPIPTTSDDTNLIPGIIGAIPGQPGYHINHEISNEHVSPGLNTPMHSNNDDNSTDISITTTASNPKAKMGVNNVLQTKYEWPKSKHGINGENDYAYLMIGLIFIGIISGIMGIFMICAKNDNKGYDIVKYDTSSTEFDNNVSGNDEHNLV